jgi:hypothetical protein
LTLCGIEVYGHYTSIDNDLDVIDYSETKLNLAWAKNSPVAKAYPWFARKLVASQGTPQPNISKRRTQTCTHSENSANNWVQLGL